jgi:hypothetical protein
MGALKLGKLHHCSEIMSRSWDGLITQSAHILPCSNLAMKGNNVTNRILYSDIFFIGVVRGGVQLGPLGTTAISRPIVPAPGDYDDGMMIGRANRSTQTN